MKKNKRTHISAYEDFNAITIKTEELPILKPNQIRIKMLTASLNKADLLLFLGQPKLIRLFFGFKKTKKSLCRVRFLW